MEATPNQLATATLQFLDRTSLTGNEALTLIACKNWLTKIANAPQAVPESDELINEQVETIK